MKTSVRPLAGFLMCALLAACAGGGNVRPAAPAAASIAQKAATPVLASAPAVASPMRAAASLSDSDAQARFHAALGLMKNQQFADAETALGTLTHDYPQLSGPWTNLGIIQAQAKHWAEARTSFSRAIAANPANVVALNWLGTACRTLGDNARAEQAYLQAIQAQPAYAPTHLNLAVLYDLALQRHADALGQYRVYQQVSREQKPIVQAWIKDLELPRPSSGPSSASAPAVLAASAAP